MNKFWLNIAGTLVAAGIVANVTFMWNVNARLTRIETKMGIGALAKNER